MLKGSTPIPSASNASSQQTANDCQSARGIAEAYDRKLLPTRNRCTLTLRSVNSRYNAGLLVDIEPAFLIQHRLSTECALKVIWDCNDAMLVTTTIWYRW